MISHHHRAVFVHIPKCGGQSIEQAFLQDLGLDWRRRAPLLLRANDLPALGPPRLAHLLGSEYVKYRYMTEEQFRAYFKFSVVRDPYRRVISHFHYMSGREQYFKSVASWPIKLWRKVLRGPGITFDEFLMEWLPAQFSAGDGDATRSQYWFVRCQCDYIYDAAGRPLMDKVIRLENLSEDFDDVRSICGLKSKLTHVNKSKGSITSQALSPAHVQAIEEIYADDFELLGYERRSRRSGLMGP